MKFGIHCSIRKGFLGALEEARVVGCDTMQMFTHSPRVWKFRFPPEDVVCEFIFRRKEYSISPLVIHTAYLPNPASSNYKIFEYSKELLKLEFEWGAKFFADYIVMHPGSFSEGESLETGIKNLVVAIDFCFSSVERYSKVPMLLLENVCRNGRKIGSSFSELKEIIDKSKYSGLIGICIDTAHLYAYGYELEKEDGFKKMVSDIKKSIGINKLKLFHFNDTLSLAGSQVDRHYHIGKGRIGIEGFKRIISFKKFSSLPAIIETPKEAKFTEISKKDIENIKLLKKISVDIKSDRSMMRIIS